LIVHTPRIDELSSLADGKFQLTAPEGVTPWIFSSAAQHPIAFFRNFNFQIRHRTDLEREKTHSADPPIRECG
jgi:hypothetical protein